mmetsp:Transcript_14467/g.46738  ORF Transcript_14467/g.46738 Transcript_14467/m.46738 type:complete len:135 (+) Transcript_14467:104-508(+)
MDHEDPFTGLLERSSVAQALREARASLARPSRPLTAVSRSLFQQASGDDSCGPNRPSSSYSLKSLNFVRDTFASSSCGSAGSTRSGGSMRGSSSRSGLRSRDSLASLSDIHPIAPTMPINLAIFKIRLARRNPS